MSLPRTPAAPGIDRRLVAVFLVTQTLGYVALFTAFPVVLTSLAADLDASRTSVTLAATIATLTGAAAAVPIGRLLDRSGGRLTMTLGALMQVAGLLGWASAESLPHLYLSLAVVGLGQAMSTYDTAFAVLVAVTPAELRQKAIVRVTLVAGVATYALTPLLGWIEVEHGWRSVVVAVALAHLLVTAPLHFVAVPGKALHRAKASQREGRDLRSVLRDPTFWTLTFSLTAQTAATTALMTFLIAYLRDQGVGPVAATWMPLVVGVTQVVSRLAVRGPGSRWSMAVMCTGAFLIQGAGLLLLPVAGDHLWLVVACMICAGVGSGVGLIARPIVVADNFGTLHFATALAVMTVPLTVSRAFSPLVGAWLGDWRFPVLFGVVSLLAAGAMATVAWRAQSRPPESATEPASGSEK